MNRCAVIDARTPNGLLTTLALERFTFAALIVDHGMELVWANDAGRLLLASGDVLNHSMRHICANRSAETHRLHELVGKACGTGFGARGGGMALTGRNGLEGSSVFVTPLHFAQDDIRALRLRRRRFALLLVQRQSDNSLPKLGFMQQIYGLSGQECRLLELLVAGHELRAASKLLDVTYETSRQYLKQVFGKTGTRSQSQLMKVVLEHPAYFVDADRRGDR